MYTLKFNYRHRPLYTSPITFSKATFKAQVPHTGETCIQRVAETIGIATARNLDTSLNITHAAIRYDVSTF